MSFSTCDLREITICNSGGKGGGVGSHDTEEEEGANEDLFCRDDILYLYAHTSVWQKNTRAASTTTETWMAGKEERGKGGGEIKADSYKGRRKVRKRREGGTFWRRHSRNSINWCREKSKVVKERGPPPPPPPLCKHTSTSLLKWNEKERWEMRRHECRVLRKETRMEKGWGNGILFIARIVSFAP